MNNYYKILEVDRDASSEVIEKAYKALAKKYHPDLQEANMKQKAEEKLKVINEAYEILSNPDSRAKYDETLKQSEVSEEDFNRLSEENRNLYNEINNLKHYNARSTYNNDRTNNTQNNTDNYYEKDELRRQQEEYQKQYEQQLEYENQIQQAREKAYHDAYIQDLKNRGYKIKYKKTPKEYFKNFLALIITIAILIGLWHIPFIHNFFVRLYEENSILQYIVNLFT